MSGALVVVPCGRSKIWDKHPEAGPTRAADASTGTPFKLNRQYAERFGDRRAVLSAKYGFIEPDFQIPCPYEVSFKRVKSNPISISELRQQVEIRHLHDYHLVIGLGGEEYRRAISEAFTPFTMPIVFPFAGLPIGLAMRATKHAIESGHSGFSEGR